MKRPVYWQCSEIKLDQEWLSWCDSVLSSEERDHAGRRIFLASGARYRSSHGGLRLFLSQYTGVAADVLEFVRTSSGKPALYPPRCAFNFSHTDTHWAIAVHDDPSNDLGIDIETIERFDKIDMAFLGLILSEEEQEVWGAVRLPFHPWP